MKRSFYTIIITVVIIVSLTTVMTTSTNDIPFLPYPSGIPSKITPFNITITLHWSPYTIANPTFQSDLATNGSFGSLKGSELPIYTTLLPMFPNMTILKYNIQVLNLEGPSNITLQFSVNMAVEYRSSGWFTGVMGAPIHGPVLDTKINNSVSGAVNASFIEYQPNKNNTYDVMQYSYANMMRNISAFMAYSEMTLQPEPDNHQLAWNHSLTVKVSLAGFEDRPFFNYLRTEKGYPAWQNADFTPLNMSSQTNTGTNDQTYTLQPLDQPSTSSYSPEQVIYLSNTTDYQNKVLQVKLQANATKDFRVIITASRGIFADFFTTTNSYSVTTPEVGPTTDMTLQIPWENMTGLNLKVYSFNKTSGEMNTSLGAWYTSATNYTIANKIVVGFEAVNEPWDMWLTNKVQVNLLDNITLPNNTMKLQMGQQTFDVNFTFGSLNGQDITLGPQTTTTIPGTGTNTGESTLSNQKTKTTDLNPLFILIAMVIPALVKLRNHKLKRKK